MSFTFVMGFVANTQVPPLLLGLRALLYRPNQRETIAMGDCYILCWPSRVTWSALATHRQRCERFPFAAWCNRKGVIEDLCLLLAPDAVVTAVLTLDRGTVCFVSVELGAFVLPLCLFFVKNIAVILVEVRESDSHALTCEATWGLPLFGCSQASTGSVW